MAHSKTHASCLYGLMMKCYMNISYFMIGSADVHWNSQSDYDGTAFVNVRNPELGSVNQLYFMVVNEETQPILGTEEVIELDLVKINCTNFVFAYVRAPWTFIGNYISVFDNGLS